tara:strand:- start:122 stop:502 length:381 start_codon:yes stop_codon:yes gene_type:complete
MKRKKMSKKKEKKQLESLSQAHGKDETVPSTLDQVWGDDGTWKYGTHKAEEYEKKLNSMPKVDLQNHATKVGIIPIDNRPMLTQRLVREFKKHVSTYTAISVPLESSEKNPEEIDPEVLKILSEGR